MQLLLAERHPRHPGWQSAAWHCHQHHELVLVVRGDYAADTDAGPVSIAAGEAVAWPAGHRHRPRNPTTEGGVVQFLAWSGSAPPPAITLTDHAGRLRCLSSWLIDDGDEGLAPQLLPALLRELHRLTRSVAVDAIERARYYLAENLHEPLTMSEVARIAGLGPRQLQRRFQARYGVNPKTWLGQARTERALALLEDGDAPLAEIARAVGWRSPAHLSRAIHAATGRWPSELR